MKIKGKGSKKYIALYYYIQDGGKKVYLGEMSLFAAACKAAKLAKSYLSENFRLKETEFLIASPEVDVTTTIVALRANGRGSIEFINY